MKIILKHLAPGCVYQSKYGEAALNFKANESPDSASPQRREMKETLRKKEMIEQQKQFLNIENLRNYPAEVVDELRRLLASDAPARPDPHRADFYELEGPTRVFYVHVSANIGSVLLLGIWPREAVTDAAASRDKTKTEIETGSWVC
jgi:hypothetical protein